MNREAFSVSPIRAASQGAAQNEPSMLLHRPFSARSQDVRHVLTRTFKDLFTRDPISSETINNLITTRGGDDDYHDHYVESLQKVYTETQSQLEEISSLEKHIMQAQAIALSSDERATNKVADGNHDLGIPTGSNHFRSCIDYDLLKAHNLLTPDVYANYPLPKITKPATPPQPGYLNETENFVNATKDNKELMERLRRSRFTYDADPKPSTLRASEEYQVIPEQDDRSEYSIHLDGSEPGDVLDTIAVSNKASGSAKKKKKSKKDKSWTEQLAVEQREQERLALERLQVKTNYLKNPRFNPAEAKLLTKANKVTAKELNIKQTQPEPQTLDTVQLFLAIPSVVTFTEYEVGQVYEATLELKNISSALRPIRVLPTKTNFFTVGLGQFPGEQGLVASGMSAQFKVRFMPDSLGEYTDVIEVQSQSGTPLPVKIIARRPPPVLTLPSTVNVGECLVGGTKIAKYYIRNDGGHGKFCFLPKEKWAVTNFKSTVNPAMMDIAPFQIRPSVFELRHGETTAMEVIFRPTATRKVNHSVLILCDNCNMRECVITGEGQIAGVEFVAVDGGTSDVAPGELRDSTAHRFIRFDDLNSYTYTQKTMILSNTTNVALPFEWMVVKPHIVMKDPESTEETTPSARTLDVESSFSIEPQNGILEPSGIANFTLTFAPPEVNKYHSVLHLVLPSIPHRKEIAEKGETDEKSSEAVETVTMDVTALEVECKAECVPLKVLIQPYAIYVNGKNLMGTTVRKQFTMVNNSVSPITFQWDQPHSENILEVTPALGEIGMGMSADMEISITGCKVGKMHETIHCYVKNMAEPLTLHVEFEVKGPEIFIDEPDINFGLVRFGTTAQTSLTLHNDSQLTASYHLREKMPANHSDRKSEFLFTPASGELRPLETRKVVVDFFPQCCQTLQTYIEMFVSDGGETRTVAVRADVQNPEVCLLSCNLRIPKLFVNMPMTQTVTIVNKTKLRCQYTWGEPVGDQSNCCSIDLVKSGELGPRENTEVEITFTAHEQGKITDVVLPCHISGMDEPLLLSISANVEGLQVAYCVQSRPDMPNFDEETADSSLIDFGDVQVEMAARQYLYMRNKTSIPSEYCLTVKNYSSRPPTPPVGRYRTPSAGRKLFLNKTPNIADPLAVNKERAQIELQQQLLKTNKGLAIVPTPYSGKLAPYEELVVEIAVYNDMWGSYTDTLTCKVGDLEPYDIPIKVNVTGIPLKFHMAAADAGKDATLRFGTHASNSRALTRSVRINNHSPYDIRVDWQMFNVQANDDQLIDCVLAYGDAFPRKDAAGNILTDIPQTPEPPPERPPTTLIPNTPDSTPAASRISMGSRSPSPSRTRPGSTLQSVQEDPLIKVIIRSHEGHAATKPFSVKPEQMVVPARDKGFINVTFNPESGDPMGEECLSYIMGYLNLEPRDTRVPEKVKRSLGYAMLPMHLNLTGNIKPAFLSNEYMDDEGLRFRGVASDLLRNGPPSPDSSHVVTNGVKLTNLTQAMLPFKVEVPHPFVYTHCVPNVPLDKPITLKPNESCEVYVGFCISPSQLDLVEELSEELDDVIGEKPLVLVRREQERQLHFCQSLKILFTSGAVQELPLHASLVLPAFSLEAGKQTLDFGTCLVNQSKQMTLVLKNRTLSASHWHIEKIDDSSACCDDTFTIAPSSGILDAHIAHVTKSDVLIAVTFLAREGCYHEAEYVIRGMLSEEPLCIKLKGVGSFDEKHENLLATVVPSTAE